MEPHQTSEPLGDPFFDAVRRRHPDIDIVLLPPEAPVEPPFVDETVVAADLSRVAALAQRLWAAAAPGSDASPSARVAHGEAPGSVRATARLATRRADGSGILAALSDALGAEGWAVDRPPGAVERLLAGLDDLTVSASYAEGSGALLLEVAATSLPVGKDAARELARAAGGAR